MEKAQHSTSYFAILSGGCAAAASLFGKLSGLHIFEGPFVILRAVFFALMIICNGGVWTLYTKALQTANSSLSATVLSAASNYFLSAFMGFLIFGEVASLLWWSGMVLVLTGLILIANDQAKSDDRTVQAAEHQKNR